ncbi:hypothetical protein F2P81_022279 [Scophthalmus maximus]|uniref:mRNA decay factor PAT1 domain-containing protein n=1 Tax=Scophthalmus maximus TaxID=52904 RepID=A0A6A4RZT7_SCOMX|nr:hypothetical protein F2P81_022279 [Scophthalmus maximus]
MAEEDEEINVHNEETFGTDLDAQGTTEDPSSGLLQFVEPLPPPPPPAPPTPPLPDPKPPSRHSSPSPPRQKPQCLPRTPLRQRGRVDGTLLQQNQTDLRITTSGSPIFSRQPLTPRQLYNQVYYSTRNQTYSDTVKQKYLHNVFLFVLNQPGRFMFPSSRPCPSTPQSLTPKMMQLRFGANSPRPSPFYSPSSNPVQHFRYPGPVTQLHPQHKRLLSQKQGAFQRKFDGWDPYCNLMTTKEREWITRLQMIQLQSENPYLEDYYYQEYYRRIEAKMAEEELGIRGKREPPKLTTPYITKTDSYAPVVHIEGSLGQVAVSTCYSPRRAIGAVHAVQAQGPLEEQKDMRQQRLEVLSKIEKLFIALLEVEETARMKTPVLSEAEERRLGEKTQWKVENIYSQLQDHNPADSGGEFLPFLLVSKGKRLLARLLPFLKQDSALKILRIVTSNLPTLMSRDAEEALPVLYPALRNVIGGLSFSQLIKVLKDLITSEPLSTYESLTVTCQNKFGLSLLYALLSQGEKLLSSGVRLEPSIGDFETWTDTIFQVAGQLSQCSLVEPLILPSNLLTLFCRYLDKRTVHQLKSNIDSFKYLQFALSIYAPQLCMTLASVGQHHCSQHLDPKYCNEFTVDLVRKCNIIYCNSGYGAAAGVSSANGGKSNGYGAAADVNNGRGVKGKFTIYHAFTLFIQIISLNVLNIFRLFQGYGGAAGVTNGQGGKPQGYGVQAGPANGQQMKGNGYGAQAGGYGVQAGPANGQKMKGNGYGAQAGGYGGQGTKGNGYGAPAAVAPNGNGGHLNGNNAAAAGHNGFATKGKGQGAAAGPSNGSGVRPNGQGGAGSKPMKGYGRPSYGAGYGRNGYNGYRAQPMAGFNGGHGHAGLGLGSRNGNGGMKGPMQDHMNLCATQLNSLDSFDNVKISGTNGAAGVPNGQGAKPNGYAGARAPNGNGAMPNGYGYPNGGTNKPAKPGYGSFLNGYGATPKGYGNGAIPNGHGRGRKPNGYGAAAGAGVPNGYGAKPNGQGVRNGAAFGGYGGKLNGYGMMPNGKGTKGAGASNGKGLKGGVFSPVQSSAAPEEGVPPQQAITQDYNAGAGASTGMNTKGYGAGAGVPNTYGAKPNGYDASAGGTPNGGASKPALRYPYAGNPEQPGNAHAGEAGKSKSGYGNGYSAGVQPDYASFGQGVPTADAKSGGARQVPYNGAPVVPAGLDGISQFEPQSAGLGPNGKLGSMYGGMGGLPFGGQKLGMGAEKSSAKYGYGRMPYEAQPAGLNPEVKSTGTYGLAGSPYQPEPLGLGHNGKLTSQYGNQGSYQSQPLESAYEGRSGGEYDTAGLPYESLPSEPDSAVKSYAKGGVPTPATAVEGEGMSVDRYDHLGYIYGHVQPEVVAFPAAPTPSPTMAYPSGPSYLPEEASFTPDVLPGAGAEDLPDPAGTASLDLDSAPATETHGVIQLPEQPDDLLQEQLPRQIHIQQHLKLHFHPQGEKNGKHDLNGFFGNSGYQGYRPVSTAQECLRSVFYMHNELGNIYTHGIPFVLFLVLMPFNIPWMEVDSVWICVVHYLACLCPTVGSVVYHVFMNHVGGEHVYDTLLSLDMFGVCLVNTLGALPIIHITLLCYPAMQQAALLTYILLSAYGIYCATTARTNILRLQAFVWQAVFRFSLFLFRVYGSGVGSPSSLRLFVIMDSLAVLGGLVNIIQIPERFSPGLFDNWGNSHQIMHIMVTCSIVYLHWGTLEDLAWIKTYQCPTE